MNWRQTKRHFDDDDDAMLCNIYRFHWRLFFFRNFLVLSLLFMLFFRFAWHRKSTTKIKSEFHFVCFAMTMMPHNFPNSNEDYFHFFFYVLLFFTALLFLFTPFGQESISSRLSSHEIVSNAGKPILSVYCCDWRNDFWFFSFLIITENCWWQTTAQVVCTK